MEDEVFSINEAMVVNDIIDETDSEAEESDVDELYEEGIISVSVSSVFNLFVLMVGQDYILHI